MSALVQAALAAREAGLSTISVRVNKKPAVSWKRYRQKQASPRQVEAWFLTRTQRGFRFWLESSVVWVSLSGAI